MAYLYDLTDTWNAAGTVFNAIKMNVTNSASAAGSKIVSLQVGSTDRFTVDKDGNGYFSGTLQAVGAISFPNAYLSGNSGTIGMQDNTASILAYNGTGSGGITNTLRFITGASERMRIDGSGNVGIGDGSPTYKLVVNGDLRVSGTGGDIRIQSATGTTAATGDSVLYNDANNLIFSTGTTTAERMRISNTGNIGIGTSSPDAALDVAKSTGNFILRDGTTANASIFMTAAGSSYAEIQAAKYGINYDMPLVLQRQGGNVGIGTSSPGYKVTAAVTAGSDAFFADGNTQSYSGYRIRAGASGQQWAFRGGNTTMALTDVTAGADRLAIDTSGNLGLGVTPSGSDWATWLYVGRATINPGPSYDRMELSQNYVRVGSADKYIANGYATQYRQISGEHQWRIAGSGSAGGTISFTQAMTLDASGNLGIGTSSTGSGRLTVAGGNGIIVNGNGASGYNVSQFINDNAISLSVGVSGSTAAGWTQNLAHVGVNSNAPLVFGTNSTERMRIDSSGNLGIGTSSPSQKLEVNGQTVTGNITVKGDGTEGGQITLNNVANSAAAYSFDVDSGSNGRIFTTTNNTNLQIGQLGGTGGIVSMFTGGSERMRIGSGGGVAIGGTGTDASLHIQASYGGYDRLTQIAPSGTSKNAFNIMAAKNSGGGDNWWTWGVRTDAVWCLIPGVDSAMTSSTGIYFDSTAQAYKPGGGSWQATSDVRVKTNITPITDAASRIMALKPSAFDYRAPEAHAGRVSDRGFIAQEFEEVYPHSVGAIAPICDEEKDFFADGEAMKTLGLNNDFFADLVALVQEQQTTINDLRARVAQLEGN